MTTELSLPDVANGGAVRAVYPAHFAEQRARVLVDDHDAILPADEHAMPRRLGDEVVPAPRSSHGVGVRDLVGTAALCGQATHHQRDEQTCDPAHSRFPRERSRTERYRRKLSST
jgi:hypothetical protein